MPWLADLESNWQKLPFKFRGFQFSDDRAVLESLKIFHQSYSRGIDRSLLRFYRPSGPAEPNFGELLETVDSLDLFWQEFLRLQGQEQGSIILNEAQSFSQSLFRQSLEFLNRIYANFGRSQGGALLDLFISNAPRSSLGLHKDEQDVFTYIVKGSRRFYFWPFPVIQKVLRLPENAERETHSADIELTEELWQQAICIEAVAGETIYWPRSFWHLAESVDQEYCASLGLGLFPEDANPFRFHRKVQYQLNKESATFDGYRQGRDFSIPAKLTTLGQMEQLEAFQLKLEHEWRKFYNAGGFQRIPNPRSFPSLIDIQSRIRLDGSYPLDLYEDKDKIRLYWQGQAFEIDKKHKALLNALASGEELESAEFMRTLETKSLWMAFSSLGLLVSAHAGGSSLPSYRTNRPSQYSLQN